MSNKILNSDQNKSSRSRSIWLLLGAAFVVLALSVTGSQCAKTTDGVLSPSALALQSEGIADCISLCVAEAKESRTAEQDRHKDVVMDCEDDEECLDDEEALHTQIMEGIAEAFQVCHSGCHNQGEGGGGQ